MTGFLRVIAIALVALWPSACVTGSHEPATLEVEKALGDEDFDRVVSLLLERGYRPLDVEAEQRRIRSDWMDTGTLRRPGLKRLHLDFPDPHRIELLVEVKWLRLGILDDPYWTTPAVDYDEERALLDMLEGLFSDGPDPD